MKVYGKTSQMYSISDIGRTKTEIAKQVAMKYGNDKPIHCLGKFEENSPIDNIVFSCFDNMAARKLLFSKWKEYQLSKTKEYREQNPNEINIFLDGRLVAEQFQVFTVKSMNDIKAYETTLFSDDEVDPLPCSYKATCHTGSLIAGVMVANFLNHVVNKKIGDNIRDVPFYIQFDNAIMNYIKMNSNEYIQKSGKW